MFHDVRRWNREHIDNYKEIYLEVPLEVLCIRDQKSSNRMQGQGRASNVYGMDLQVEYPSCPDVVLINDGKKRRRSISVAFSGAGFKPFGWVKTRCDLR